VDLKDDRVVWPVEAKKAADKIGAKFMETSVVERVNVDESFKMLADLIMKDG
jgi:hypothetical protein